VLDTYDIGFLRKFHQKVTDFVIFIKTFS